MRFLLVAFACMWCVFVVFGFFVVGREGQTPGASTPASRTWPGGVALERGGGKPTLLVALHPDCPCSRATVAELERLMVGRGQTVDLHILFVQPRGVKTDPRGSSLWGRAERVPGAHLLVDDNGAIASRFGALTSGQVVLYDAAGTLRFAGGITGSRGHEGDNAGRSAVETILDRGNGLSRTPVFGCALFAEKN